MSKRKIVSYSYYGSFEFYPERFLLLLPYVREIYDGWDIRIYFAEDAPNKYVAKFQESDCELVSMGKSVGSVVPPSWSGRHRLACGQSGVLWRYLPFWDDTIDVFVVRDMDAVPSYTLRYSVDLWTQTDKLFHATQMWQTQTYMPGGGTVSGRGGALIGKYSRDALMYLARSECFTYGDDQTWLSRVSDSVLKDSRLVHCILPLKPTSLDAVMIDVVPAVFGGLIDRNREMILSLDGGHLHFIEEELDLLDRLNPQSKFTE
jgi:hypothetical protein